MSHNAGVVAIQSASGRSVRLDGRRCLERRRALGLSQGALAEGSRGPLAVSIQTVKRAERGEAIYLQSAQSIARLLGVPLETLMLRASPTLAIPDFGTQMPCEARVSQLASVLCAAVRRRFSTWHMPLVAAGDALCLQTEVNVSARYMLSGFVRVAADRLRVSIDLEEATAGIRFWGADFDMACDQDFLVEDRMVSRIVSLAAERILARELDKALARDIELDAWQLVVRGIAKFHQCTALDNAAARELFKRAVARDPTLGLARYMLILSLQHDLLNQWSENASATLADMCSETSAFQRCSPQSPLMHVASAYVMLADGDNGDARRRLREAKRLDRSSAAVRSLYGQTLAMNGQIHEGLNELENARRLGPFDRARWTVFLTKSLALFADRSYQSAAKWAQRAVRERPTSPICRAAFAAARAELGPLQLAGSAIELGALQEMTLSGFRAVLASTSPEIAERFVTALRKAGMPEHRSASLA